MLVNAVYLGVQEMTGVECDTYYVSSYFNQPHALTSESMLFY